MRNLVLGHERGTRKPVAVPKKSFATHWHLIGGTGKGKTTAIHTLLHQLLLDPVDEECFFIFDRMGNLSQELLLWMTPLAAGLKRVFLVHGEGDQQTVLAQAIRERFGLEVVVPGWGQGFEL